MKIPLLYGLGISIAGAVLTLVSYFLGYHNDVEKFGTGQTISFIGGMLIMIAGLYLGMKAVRENRPDRSLSYGRAVGTGALITLFSGLFSAVFVLLYGKVVNPAFHEIIYETQVNEMVKKGATQEAVDAASGFLRFFSSAVWMAIASVIFSPLFGTIVSLIIALFVKRPPAPAPAPVTAV